MGLVVVDVDGFISLPTTLLSVLLALVISIDKFTNYDLGKAINPQHILEQETGTPSSLPNSKSSCDVWCTCVAFCLCSLFFTHVLFMYI